MKRFFRKSSSKSSSKKVKFTINPKSNVIMEDKSSPNINVKFIFDKDEPFYKHIFKKENNGTSNN